MKIEFDANRNLKYERRKFRKKIIYKPPESELKPCKPTFGVKFSNDMFIHPSLLDKWNIKYEESDLEYNPIFGKALRIKNDENEKLEIL